MKRISSATSITPLLSTDPDNCFNSGTNLILSSQFKSNSNLTLSSNQPSSSNTKSCKHFCSTKGWIIGLVLIFGHWLVGFFILTSVFGVPPASAMTYITVIDTTIGYSTMEEVHESDSKMIFMIFYILSGTILVFGLLSGLLTDLLFKKTLPDGFGNFPERIIPSGSPRYVTRDKNNFNGPSSRGRICFGSCKTVWAVIFSPYLMFLLTLTFGIAWFCAVGLKINGELLKSPSFLTCLYFSVVSISTVGFGDVEPHIRNAGDSVLVSVWMIFGVVCYGRVLITVGDPLRRLVMNTGIEANIRRVSNRVARDLSNPFSNSQKVEKMDFIIRVLLKHNVITQEQVNELMEEFNHLDCNNDEKLSRVDFEMMRDRRRVQYTPPKVDLSRHNSKPMDR